MKFTKLESIMSEKGINSLADIARTLRTTPQAVSNWKARDQVPYHIEAKLIQTIPDDSSPVTPRPSLSVYEENTISLSDILLTMAEQLKVILLIPFIIVFLTFTYVQFIQQPKYDSWATVLLPENKTGNLDGLAGLASQFGVNVSSGSQADLSSPSLFPELLRSRIFAEKILIKKFYTEKYGKELSLLAILTYGDEPVPSDKEKLITLATASLGSILKYKNDSNSSFSVITVTVSEPAFAKELADVTLNELEALNRYFKSQTISQKIIFINQRIEAVKGDLEISEKHLKNFNEQNRQISSPALQLDLDRLTRGVEIQKGIYLTLKQQQELAKIEEVQEASIVQILDRPQVPLAPSNKNLKLALLLSGIFGLGLGILLGFIRAYTNNSDTTERRKLRRVRNFVKKKFKDIFLDRRVSGIISVLFILGLPYYLGHESKNPVYFGLYSPKLMLINTIYVFTLVASLALFIYLSSKKKS